MIETTVNVILHREMYDPTPAGWDDWNIECDLDVFLEKDPIPAGWDDWSTEFVRDINDIQDSTHMGWDDWNETSTIKKNEDTTQPARDGMIETSLILQVFSCFLTQPSWAGMIETSDIMHQHPLYRTNHRGLGWLKQG